MIRSVNAISDRLLGLVVPRVTAHADPCGAYFVYCYCVVRQYYQRICCSVQGTCGGCFQTSTC